MKDIGEYKEISIPITRKLISEPLNYALKMHYVKGLVEFDVTKARDYVKQYKETTGETLSFTAWVVKCISQAVNEHKQVHALKEKQKFIIFKDIDINVIVESIIEKRSFPVNYIIRKTQEKTFREIHNEIREAQSKTEEEIIQQSTSKKVGLFLKLPKFLRNILFWRKLRLDPFFTKKNMGTINVTAIGMFGRGRGWGVPIPIAGLSITIGGISTQPAVVNDNIEFHEFLCLTIMFDHDVVDGAPAARFLNRLKELMESGFGLKE